MKKKKRNENEEKFVLSIVQKASSKEMKKNKMGKKYICEQILYFLSDIKEKEEKKEKNLIQM